MIISGTTIKNITVTDISALYSFTAFTFTNGPATGNTGPNLSQSLSSYDTATNTWLNDTQYFNVTNGIQLWTVPATGNYTIEAYGASGGFGVNTRVGKGAYIKGQFALTQGDKIKILVGQAGSANASIRQEYAGGGGTFVVKNTAGTPTTSDIYVIAGGGGGVGNTASSYANAAGSINANGNASTTSSAFGTSGNGGQSSNQTVQGGAGFSGNGTNGSIAGNDTPPAQAFIFGGNGGNIKWAGSTDTAILGGFGGGGSTNRWQNPTAVAAMGGGGGYSGGAGGYGSNTYNGGGGGSYNNGINQTNTSNVRLGNGSVIITRV